MEGKRKVRRLSKELRTHYHYMCKAFVNSTMSNGIRLKVGAVIVTPSLIELSGWNGTPRGRDNSLEFIDEHGEYVTKPEVIHAELNAVLKAAEQGVSIKGSTVYITHAPCQHCAGMLVQCGVKRVFYRENYRDMLGVDLLNERGVNCELLPNTTKEHCA